MAAPVCDATGSPKPENFQEFFIKWKEKQKNQLDELVSALKIEQPQNYSLHALVQRVVAHYDEFYKVKTTCAQGNVFPVLSPPWNSPLEDAFVWIGGWRPSSAFQLLYSVSGLQLESRLSELLRGATTGDLSDLSSEQLCRIDALHRKTIQEERKITEEMAQQQDKVADAEMVQLSHDMSESTRPEGAAASDLTDEDRVDSVMKPKEEGFQRLLEAADELRIRTLKGVINILSPRQAVHFLISAAELQLRLHDWGKQKEEKQMAALLQHPTAAAEAS